MYEPLAMATFVQTSWSRLLDLVEHTACQLDVHARTCHNMCMRALRLLIIVLLEFVLQGYNAHQGLPWTERVAICSEAWRKHEEANGGGPIPASGSIVLIWKIVLVCGISLGLIHLFFGARVLVLLPVPLIMALTIGIILCMAYSQFKEEERKEELRHAIGVIKNILYQQTLEYEQKLAHSRFLPSLEIRRKISNIYPLVNEDDSFWAEITQEVYHYEKNIRVSHSLGEGEVWSWSSEFPNVPLSPWHQLHSTEDHQGSPPSNLSSTHEMRRMSYHDAPSCNRRCVVNTVPLIKPSRTQHTPLLSFCDPMSGFHRHNSTSLYR